ncbi:YhgE/Pip-like protein [Clostridium tetanomorphum]|uniref:YhgE/Pip domain-containing protein n=1 Tax=Clostridium tetanomorphum TaxID=1553 RepID=UPI00044AEF22|nr:hypothetical protein [Clostridium tetanomorphum]KAJ49493.1 hypothetical protein CTM_22856 [Clostridium tetanomorphum DSM 665]KAJ51430.1 hypothetical protein CTM_12600 [Clostridium tetanomorphum DSM 665]MBP1863849.1 YhgE/Pip-like protein [Clostridium tetanomorphum]NRS84927.1 YhgE/Pip-like protein [Clostridium tetanomorphum]NRZ98143.1 YhgE/Pip-like protein [Clostridium tetanomorphum]
MKGKVIPAFIIMSAMIVTSTTSFYVGKQVQERKFLAEQQDQTKEIKESTKIAVVNQDLGTEYKDKRVNYALDFFNFLDNGYEITNREAAEKGIENGKYGAMIVVPGNFSKNITTVNEVTPSKVKIYYQSNDKLSKENKLIVSRNIGEFEKKLNNKLSYMYLSGIFNELHNGQDYASDILKNDDIDLEAINSINDSGILASIKLTTLEDKDIKFNDLDLSKDFDENKKIISEVDQKYRDKMITKETQLNSIKDDLVDVMTNENTGVKTFTNRLKKMDQQELKAKFAGRHKYNYDGLANNCEANIFDVNLYLEDLTKDEGKIDDLVDKYEKQTLSKVNEKGTNAIKKSNEELKEIQEKTDSDLDIIKNNSISNLENLKKNIKEKNQNDPKIQSLNEEYLLYGQMISKLKETNPIVFDDIYNQVVNNHNINYNKILKNPLGDLNDGNFFKNSNELKQYINDGISEKNEKSVSSRSSKYRKFNESDENDKSINDTIDILNKVKNHLKEISSSAQCIMNDEDYKYLKDIFNQNLDESLGARLKIKDNLISPIKDLMDGNNRKQLISTIKSNNTKNVDSVKEIVQEEVEKVVEGDGPIDIIDVINVFEKDYISKFNNIITHVSNIDKTPEKTEDDEEILNLLDQYDKSNENLNNKVSKQLDEYNKVEDQVREQANKHVDTMKNDLDKGIKESKNKLSSGLQNAKTTKEKTTKFNQEKLGSLVNVLSNSRVGTVENTDVYKFIINPVSAVQNKTLGGSIVKPQQNDSNEVKKTVVLILATYIMLRLAMVLYRKKIKLKLNK